jgi:hypothetical protein
MVSTFFFILKLNKYIYLLINLLLLFLGELENSGLVNIREQINKLSTDLNVTRKGLEVFSGERKLIVPSNIEIEFGIELKKKMRKIKVIFQCFKSYTIYFNYFKLFFFIACINSNLSKFNKNFISF